MQWEFQRSLWRVIGGESEKRAQLQQWKVAIAAALEDGRRTALPMRPSHGEGNLFSFPGSQFSLLRESNRVIICFFSIYISAYWLFTSFWQWLAK